MNDDVTVLALAMVMGDADDAAVELVSGDIVVVSIASIDKGKVVVEEEVLVVGLIINGVSGVLGGRATLMSSISSSTAPAAAAEAAAEARATVSLSALTSFIFPS